MKPKPKNTKCKNLKAFINVGIGEKRKLQEMKVVQETL